MGPKRARVVEESSDDETTEPPPPSRSAQPPASVAASDDVAPRGRGRKLAAIALDAFEEIITRDGGAVVRGATASASAVMVRERRGDVLTPFYVGWRGHDDWSLQSVIMSALRDDDRVAGYFDQHSNVQNVANLVFSDRERFPGLPEFRGDHVFLNGIFNARANTFVPFDEDYAASDYDGVAAFKSYPIDFDQLWLDDDDICVDKFESLFHVQGWAPEKIDLCKAFLGRLAFPLNTVDEWDNTPFLFGKAGAGKTTLVNAVVGSYFAKTQIGTISNTIENKFGLQTIYDKEVVIANDIDGALIGQNGLDTGVLKNMIEGGAVSVAIKFAPAKVVTWRSPLLMTGNAIPPWPDAQGEFSRRITYFDFTVEPPSVDSTLAKALSEPDAQAKIMIGCTRSYLNVVQRFQGLTMSRILESYDGMKDIIDQVRLEHSPVLRFVRDAFVADPHAPPMTYMQVRRVRCEWAEANEVDVKKIPLGIEFKSALAKMGIRYMTGKEVDRYSHVASEIHGHPSWSAAEKETKLRTLRNGVVEGGAKNMAYFMMI